MIVILIDDITLENVGFINFQFTKITMVKNRVTLAISMLQYGATTGHTESVGFANRDRSIRHEAVGNQVMRSKVKKFLPIFPFPQSQAHPLPSESKGVLIAIEELIKVMTIFVIKQRYKKLNPTALFIN